MSNLNKLKVIHNNLMNIISSEFPVSVDVRSNKLRYRKAIVEKKLKEVEDTLTILSRRKVFMSSTFE